MLFSRFSHQEVEATEAADKAAKRLFETQMWIILFERTTGDNSTHVCCVKSRCFDFQGDPRTFPSLFCSVKKLMFLRRSVDISSAYYFTGSLTISICGRGDQVKVL